MDLCDIYEWPVYTQGDIDLWRKDNQLTKEAHMQVGSGKCLFVHNSLYALHTYFNQYTVNVHYMFVINTVCSFVGAKQQYTRLVSSNVTSIKKLLPQLLPKLDKLVFVCHLFRETPPINTNPKDWIYRYISHKRHAYCSSLLCSVGFDRFCSLHMYHIRCVHISMTL